MYLEVGGEVFCDFVCNFKLVVFKFQTQLKSKRLRLNYMKYKQLTQENIYLLLLYILHNIISSTLYCCYLRLLLSYSHANNKSIKKSNNLYIQEVNVKLYNSRLIENKASIKTVCRSLLEVLHEVSLSSFYTHRYNGLLILLQSQNQYQ
jgi:hypothetical protein